MENEIVMSEFETLIGKIQFDKKTFIKNVGGAPDSDSFRGFGATEQYWCIPTSNEWTIVYGDNGAGIRSAVSPKGEKWTAGTRDSGNWVPSHEYRGLMTKPGWSHFQRVMRQGEDGGYRYLPPPQE